MNVKKKIKIKIISADTLFITHTKSVVKNHIPNWIKKNNTPVFTRRYGQDIQELIARAEIIFILYNNLLILEESYAAISNYLTLNS